MPVTNNDAPVTKSNNEMVESGNLWLHHFNMTKDYVANAKQWLPRMADVMNYGVSYTIND
jgi:hypothetical protein